MFTNLIVFLTAFFSGELLRVVYKTLRFLFKRGLGNAWNPRVLVYVFMQPVGHLNDESIRSPWTQSPGQPPPLASLTEGCGFWSCSSVINYSQWSSG